MADWWDDLKKTFSGAPAAPAKPAIDMNRWGDVLKSSGMDETSPHYKLLKATADHVNSVPQLPERSMGSNILGVLASAGAGAGMRRAGASGAEASQPGREWAAQYNKEKELRLGQQTDAWKTGGAAMSSQAREAVILQEQNRIRQENARRQSQLYAVPGSAPDAAGAAGPAAPDGPIYHGHKGLSPGGDGAPAVGPTNDAATRGRTEGGDGSGADARPGGGDRPYSFGNSKFHTEEWKEWFRKAWTEMNSGMGTPYTVSVKNADGTSTQKELKSAGDLLGHALEKDAEAYRGSEAYTDRTKNKDKMREHSFGQLKELDTRSTAASKSLENLSLFRGALSRHIGESGTTGPMQDWMTTAKSWANGIPGVNLDISAVEEMRKASIGAATALMRTSTVGPTSDRELSTFQQAVTSASMSTAGNLRLLPFLELQAKSELAIQQAAVKHMEAKGFIPLGFNQEAAQIKMAHAQEAQKLGQQLVDDWKAGKFGQAAPAKSAAGQLTPDQENSVIKRAMELRKASDGKLSLQDAAAQAQREILKSNLGAGGVQPPGGAPAKVAPAVPARGRGGQPQTGFPVPDAFTRDPRQLSRDNDRKKREQEELQRIRTMGRVRGPV